jgi:hypothetical protein
MSDAAISGSMFFAGGARSKPQEQGDYLASSSSEFFV